MDADQLAVDLVIQTASGLLTGRFGPREAVTILASQAPRARTGAAALASREPQWSATHAELLTAIGAELQTRIDASRQRRELVAVLGELDRVIQALSQP